MQVRYVSPVAPESLKFKPDLAGTDKAAAKLRLDLNVDGTTRF